METVFSGVGGMVAKASSLGADLVADYTICHHNWQYPVFLPSDEEIVNAYQKFYGSEAHASDAESSGDEEVAADDEDANGGEGDFMDDCE